jgi:hypothetical protein
MIQGVPYYEPKKRGGGGISLIWTYPNDRSHWDNL